MPRPRRWNVSGVDVEVEEEGRVRVLGKVGIVVVPVGICSISSSSSSVAPMVEEVLVSAFRRTASAPPFTTAVPLSNNDNGEDPGASFCSGFEGRS